MVVVCVWVSCCVGVWAGGWRWVLAKYCSKLYSMVLASFACRGCRSFKCSDCRIKRNLKLWQQCPAIKPWLVRTSTGLGCSICMQHARLHGLESVPERIKPFADGRFRTLTGCQMSSLKRHAKSMFHVRCESSIELQAAPPRDCFERVLEHVTKHTAAAYGGVSGVGSGKKVLRIIMALAYASRYLDQKFLQRASRMSLGRDARKGKLCVRFTMVSDDLKVRRGILGIARGYGGGSTSWWVGGVAVRLGEVG